MYQNLENYLQEISHYLAIKDGSGDILSEIKCHILEKTEEEFGKVTEEGVAKIISIYGRPQHVAAKYLEGIEIIFPTFKRHLFLYTGILFACHFALTLVAFLFHFSMVGFPFLYIPNMNVWEFMVYLPMAYIYNLGLVVIFLYFVTQKKKEIRLPWPKLFTNGESVKEMKRPKILFLVLLILIFAFLLATLLRFGTFFFASMNDPDNPVLIMDPNASLYYSSLFLAMIGCEVIGYAARFISRSLWLDLIKNSLILLLLQLVWNSPLKANFAKIPDVNLNNVAVTFVLIITAVTVFKFLKNIVSLNIKQLFT